MTDRDIVIDLRDRLKAAAACARPVSTHELRRIFLLSARAHFAHPDNFGELAEELACYTFDPDNPAGGKLKVELINSSDPSRPEAADGVYVGISDRTFNKIGMGNAANPNTRKPDGATRTSVMQAVYTLTGRVVARNSGVADLLADSLCDFWYSMSEEFKYCLDLMSFDPVSVSAPARSRKEPNENFVREVKFSMGASYGVSVRIESHRIKKFALELPVE